MANEFVARKGLVSLGGISLPYVGLTSTYTTTKENYYVNCLSGSFTLNLHSASSISGFILEIKNSGSGTITIDPNGSETINGSSTYSLTAGQGISIVSDGSNWVINGASSTSSSLVVFDEGNLLTAGATSINFVGSGVSATATSGAVTVNISGGTGGGSPAGSDGWIQFNDSSSFGATSSLSWDKTNGRLGIGLTSSVSRLHIQSDNLGTDIQNLMNASGLLLRNSTAVTSYATRQYSPALIFEGQAWTGSAQVPQRYAIFSRPASTGSGTSGELVFAWSLGATAAFNQIAAFNTATNCSFTGQVNASRLGSSTYVQATPSIAMGGYAEGLILANSSIATSGSRNRPSPAIRHYSYAWDTRTSTARIVEFRTISQATGATLPNTPPTGRLTVTYLNENGTSDTPVEIIALNSNGNVSIGSSAVDNNNLFVVGGSSSISGYLTVGTGVKAPEVNIVGVGANPKLTLFNDNASGRWEMIQQDVDVVGDYSLDFYSNTSASYAMRLYESGVVRFNGYTSTSIRLTALDTDGTVLNSSIYLNTGLDRIGIGTTAISYPLSVGTSASNTSIYAVGDIVAFSDQSVKSDVQEIQNATEKIKQIRGVTFIRSDMTSDQRRAGVIAQEVEKVLPEVITTNPDGTKGVSYGNLTSLLIQAIKEQQGQIEELKKEIDLLKRSS